MDNLMDEIQKIDNQIDLLQKDVEYIANCYINDDTNFELPLSEDDTIIEIDYQTLTNKVKQNILEKNPNMYIDNIRLMSYIDYYYQFLV
tara:strand:+ start:663 stop:929 length:267 start_codon:yes stop_codon:yes gene_type:complete